MANELTYYAQPGVMTDVSAHAEWLGNLPDDIPALCELVQGWMIHIFWMDRYGVEADESIKQAEVNIRAADDMLARIREKDDRPSTAARPLEKKLIGNCRDFSVLFVALLRHKGIPARARCGFGTYFLPDHYEDHWSGEYWDSGQKRWRLVDAQLDTFQQEQLKITFDTNDVPRDQFVVAGQGWTPARAGEVDPEKFGIFDMHGLDFIEGNLLRDLAALNKVELLPWDCWGLMLGGPDHSEEEWALLDRAARLTTGESPDFGEIRSIYENPGLRVPTVIQSWNNENKKMDEVALDI
ncbi:MAG: transglutaminase domain-containing protein [Anaerolineae bacterium]|nr:transglutaminase domain-containing protein [Anaerolineae bacterium]